MIAARAGVAQGGPIGRPRAAVRARPRAGVTLVEVIVVLAILVAIAAVILPALGSLLSLEQRRFAKNLATTYELLHDEAVLRNVTFRIAYHLDEGFYEIEVGSPETLVFEDPQQRLAYEEAKAAAIAKLDTDDPERAKKAASGFQKLQENFSTREDVPTRSAFGGVYTPQYGDMVVPTPAEDRDSDEPPRVVYSYVFPNGFSEQVLVWVVDASDPQSGWTVEVEPLSGRVHLHDELMRPDQLTQRFPDRGPELP